jgi:hypothetical protein
MKKLIHTIIILIAFPNLCFTQTNNLVKLYSENGRSINIAEMPGKTYGILSDPILQFNGKDFSLFKIDSLGTTLWYKTIYTTSFSENISPKYVVGTADTGLLVVSTLAYLVNPAPIESTLLVKFNSNGDTLWCKRISETGFEIEPQHVIQSADGGYIITGYATGLGTGEKSIYILKTSAFGNVIWDRRINTSLQNLFGINSVEAANGDIICYAVGQHLQSLNDRVHIIRLSSNGSNIISKKSLESFSINIPYANNTLPLLTILNNDILFISKDSQNELILSSMSLNGGINWSNKIDNYNDPNYTKNKISINKQNIYVSAITPNNFYPSRHSRIDASGNIIWTINTEPATDMVPINNYSHFLLTTEKIAIGPLQKSITGPPELGLMSIDSTGKNNSCYIDSSFSMNIPYILAVVNDSLIMSSGTASAVSLSFPVTTTIQTQTNSCTNLYGNLSKIGVNNVYLSPNPSSGRFQLQLENFEPAELIITNVLGQIIKQMNIKNANTEIDLSTQTSGIYYYTLRSKNSNSINGKMVVER